MAEFTNVKLWTRDLDTILNVSRSVGKGGFNDPEDVIVVKAFIWYIGQYDGFDSMVRIPYPAFGNVDDVGELIHAFQKWRNFADYQCRGSINRLTVDGRVSRANGRYVWGTNHPWAIFHMNYAALRIAHEQNENSGIEAIAKKLPHLAYLFDVNAYFEYPE
jgi:hypothetical protein